MSYHFCSSCDKRIELKYRRSRLKSELHMNTEGAVINKNTCMNPKLCEINNLLINNVSNYDKRFVLYKIKCKGKLVFNNDISIDVKSNVMYRISVFRINLEKYLKDKINYHRIRGLEVSYIVGMNNTFTTSLDFMIYQHYIEQPMPMVEILLNRKLLIIKKRAYNNLR